MKIGMLIVYSGPSGSGKSTLIRRYMKTREGKKVKAMVSCTTRQPRKGEVHGVHYFFHTRDEFMAMVDEGLFLEYSTVHGNLYGVLWSQIELIKQGYDLIKDLDVQGVEKIRKSGVVPNGHLCDVFVMPPSSTELAKNLDRRGDTTGKDRDIRLGIVETEMDHARKYTHVIVNKNLRKTCRVNRRIVDGHRRTLAA